MDTFVEGPGGARQPVSSYQVMFGDEVPHLHRVSADGRWLASLDPRGQRLSVRKLHHERWSKHASVVQLTLPGTVEQDLAIAGAGLGFGPNSGLSVGVREFRWLADGSGFVFQGEDAVWLVPWDQRSKRLVGRRLFHGSGITVGHVLDVRTFAGGLLVRAQVYAENTYHGLFHVRLNEGQDPIIHDMTPDVGWLVSASVLARGRIVVAVQGLPGGEGAHAELWTYSTDHSGAPQRVDARPCATDECGIANWTPGSERPVYALRDGRVVIETPRGPGGIRQRVQVDFPVGARVASEWSVSNPIVHSLWMDENERRILGATAAQLIVWDRWGRAQWAWSPTPGHTIYSARFLPGTERVVVTTDQGALFVDADGEQLATRTGPSTSKIKKRHRRSRRGLTSRHFVDAMPLPGGGLALTQVERQPRRHGRSRHRKGQLHQVF